MTLRSGHDVIVLGAGIVGASIAVHLAMRGRSVLLVDRREPGRETSEGNGGIIQSEGVLPFAFPRRLSTLLAIAGNRNPAARLHWGALPRYMSTLPRYWWNSAPSRYRAIISDYAPLTLAAEMEHRKLLAAAGAEGLARERGFVKFYRAGRSWDSASADADFITSQFGIAHNKLDAAALQGLEPDLVASVAGAIHWPGSMTIADPGGLVRAYVALLERLGGSFVRGDATTLHPLSKAGWRVTTENGLVEAPEAAVATGPWSQSVLRPLGYDLPLIIKRGYNMHYAAQAGHELRNWLVDADGGFVMAPMDRGIRLTTGAEFARLESPPTPVQLDHCERIAQASFPLGNRLDPVPWIGARPCMPDMKPVIGPAPKHRGLWLALGHGHYGFTLGPVTGRLLAEAMCGEQPFQNLRPFRADRF